MLRLNQKLKPIFQKCTQYRLSRTPIKSKPSSHSHSSSSSTSPFISSSSPLIAGNLSLCFNSIKYKSFLFFPLLSLTKPFSSSIHSRFVVFADEKHHVDDLEHFEPNDIREELLLTEPGSIWMRIKMVFRVAHLLVIFLPVVLTAPVLLVVNPKSKYISWWWSLLRFSFERGGACWIKFGQWASTRPDLFPYALCQQLSLLHSSCPSHRGSHSIRTITKEMNRKMSDLFVYFDPVPMASGSIAQVHKAVTNNGRVVVVKVLHPKAYRSIMLDFRILYSVVRLASKIPTLKWLSLHEGVLEFGKSMVRQLDLRREAYNLVRFQENFKGSSTVSFPTPIYSRKSVLIETFEPGEAISHSIKSKNIENKGIASMGFNAYLKMMLIDNFTHSDLHPGNILLRKSVEGKPQLVFLDVGLVTELSPRDRDNFLGLFEAVVRGDGRRGAEMMVQYATDSQCQGEMLEQFKDEMERIFTSVGNNSLSNVKVGKVMNDVLTAVRNHHVKIESNFATLVMGTMVLEGLGKQLDPNLNLIKEAVPYFAKEELSRRFNISNWLDKWRNKTNNT